MMISCRYELKGDRAGKILLTWRFEAFEDSDKPPEVEQGEVIGTFQLTGMEFQSSHRFWFP